MMRMCVINAYTDITRYPHTPFVQVYAILLSLHNRPKTVISLNLSLYKTKSVNLDQRLNMSHVMMFSKLMTSGQHHAKLS